MENFRVYFDVIEICSLSRVADDPLARIIASCKPICSCEYCKAHKLPTKAIAYACQPIRRRKALLCLALLLCRYLLVVYLDVWIITRLWIICISQFIFRKHFYYSIKCDFVLSLIFLNGILWHPKKVYKFEGREEVCFYFRLIISKLLNTYYYGNLVLKWHFKYDVPK